MTAERKFADAETLTPVIREVFGTDRLITTVDRLLNGTKKGVYRIMLDDATTAIAYVWNADEDYWDGLLPDGHDDPSNPFAHASGIDFFEAATRRLEAVGARSPRLLLADRSRDLYPADIAVTEDVRGGTLEALLERDPDAGRQTLAQLADMLRRMHTYRAPAFGRVAWIDNGGTPPDTTCEQAYLQRALVNIATAVPRDARAAEAEAMLERKLRTLHAALDPRAEHGVVHGELCAEHTLVGPDGEPVIIDIEGLMYTDIEVEHCWMRMRFGPHYASLRNPDLDPQRVKYYQYVMHLDLVGGPLRIAEGDFPNREWMLDVADFHLQKALAYET
ncbi:Phosphotransferase enzyme family protein [Micromonospora phaseoli]|uniref:Phosphotransferase enzyme family protein n=1 Tax=Micromonospora phaseoli TaxID=1144548 RepID=A0A1H7C0J2_9ACTN|nr:phosphotransferase [Micromonospora phaseoli]PZV92716.1 phosphotransferase family enzyme [Micromonospora phaseoli]GIJ76630.1 aminoglycoside phosphotransferase [Micromonospora phaseoli]SEJ82976.1 Phosphotransferase enzyme family protein [Micromonospora phaseoli]